MQIELEEQILAQLETIAREQGRDVNVILQEMIDEYRARRNEQFRAQVRRVIEKHADLLEKLAKS